jgi:hypothetical protein
VRWMAISVAAGTWSPSRRAASSACPLELQGLAHPECLRGFLGGLEQVVERPHPVLGVREVMREDLVLLCQPVRVQLLDGQADALVQLLAPLDEERGIGHVLRERMLEHVGQLGEAPALEDQLQRGQLAQALLGALADLGEPVDQSAGELAPDRRRELERPLGRLGEAVDARSNHVLDGARHRDLAHRPGQLEPARRPAQRAALLERLDQLLHVEGVALGLLGDQGAHLGGQGPGSEHGGGHARAVLGGQRRRHDARHVAALPERVGVARAVGEHQ